MSNHVLFHDVNQLKLFEPVVGTDDDITYAAMMLLLRDSQHAEVPITHLLLNELGKLQFGDDGLLMAIVEPEQSKHKIGQGYLGLLKGPKGSYIHILTDMYLESGERFAIAKAALYNINYN